MIKPTLYVPKKNLRKLNVWLSGAIPEKETWPTPLTDRDILEFISYFSALIFQKGGTITHGSHPIFTPILAEQAKKFATSKDQLQLYVSGLWGSLDLEQYRDYATITVIPSIDGSQNFNNERIRNESLTILRKVMAKESQCIVSIGGKLHPKSQITPGVIEELQIAKASHIPSYNLGSFGGAAGREKIDKLDNWFLSIEEAISLFRDDNISFLPSTLVSYLERDSKKIILTRRLFQTLSKLF